MRILTHVRNSAGYVNASINHMFVELTAELANKLLDFRAKLDQLVAMHATPKPLWLTLLDDTPVYYSIPYPVAEGSPWFPHQQSLQDCGFVELPEYADPRRDLRLLGAVVANAQSHLVITTTGITWCLLVSGSPAGTSLIPDALLYRAAGIKMPSESEDDLSVRSQSTTS